MTTSFSLEVPDSLAGERLDRAVALLTGLSRREVAALLDTQSVLVDGAVPTKASSRLVVGSVVKVSIPDPIEIDPADPSVELDVVHEDADVLVINKPDGLVVHPGAGNPGGTMVNGLLARYPEIEGVGESGRPGIVHRLDKGTTGLLMVARTEVAYQSLVSQLASRSVKRHYQTLVEGHLNSAEGVIDAPIGRSDKDATRRAVVTSGRPARTHYSTLERFEEPDCTYLECRLETGRTHQIRVHLAAIEHSVVGDNRYGRSSTVQGLDRPFLHAASLSFSHPVTSKTMTFEAALPDDLVRVLGSLKEADAD